MKLPVDVYGARRLLQREDLESGHTLFFTRTPKQRGRWQLPDCPHCPRAKGEKREVCHTVDTGGREKKRVPQGIKHPSQLMVLKLAP
jgi:hypothetical protein